MSCKGGECRGGHSVLWNLSSGLVGEAGGWKHKYIKFGYPGGGGEYLRVQHGT